MQRHAGDRAKQDRRYRAAPDDRRSWTGRIARDHLGAIVTPGRLAGPGDPAPYPLRRDERVFMKIVLYDMFPIGEDLLSQVRATVPSAQVVVSTKEKLVEE